jgi:gamma-tubulin complex component 3
MVVNGREDNALKFTELHRHMKTKGFIKNTLSLLMFLITLSDEQDKPMGLYEIGDSFLSESMDLPQSLLPQSLQSSMSTSGIPPSSAATSGIGSLTPSIRPNSTPSIRPNSTPINLSDSTIRDQSTVNNLLISQGDQLECEVSEDVLIRDLLFVFQGINGKYITMRSSSDGFRINDEVIVHPSLIEHCHKLAELGWLYRKISNYIEAKKQDSSLGLVVQSFIAALSLELTEYYRLVAVLEAQLSADQVISDSTNRLTIRRLIVWTREPLEKLKTLAILVDGCKSLKGGALVSTLFTYAQHGDPHVKQLVKHLLDQVYRPLNTLLNGWIYEGQLHDQYNEFFIAVNLKVPNERMWDGGKYYIRTAMLPKFVSEELAKKIMTVGKSINFLRQRCEDQTELFNGDEKMWFMNEKDNCTFDNMTGDALTSVIDITYKRTNSHLLHILNNNYHLDDHLKAFRKYLLLGQGDFVKHLMDIIQSELTKPATHCYVHNLTALLETAIQSSNAKYDEQDVLSRLDVQLLDASPGDTGWDVFSLLYRVDGPISTVFTTDTMLHYLQIFNFLWRAKRIEFVLARMWKSQISYLRQLRDIPEVQYCLHQYQLITGSLVHFISQLQYYIMFECLECSWAELLKHMKTAGDLDEIITAHNDFMKNIIKRCLLDPNSQSLLVQLRTLFDRVIEFQNKSRNMFELFVAESDRRKEYELIKQARIDEGEWSETQDDTEKEHKKRLKFYNSTVIDYQSQLTVLRDSYDDTLKGFLGHVEDHIDENLQFLARRLDFNRFYRGTDTLSLLIV